MLKKILLAGIYFSALYAETSAFDAGNVNLKEPYGLTENEKVLLENKKRVENLSKGYTGVDFKTNKALERIEGIQSLMDDLNNKLFNFEGKLLELEKNSNKTNDDVNSIKKELSFHRNSINQLKKAVNELANLVESISSTQGTQSNITNTSLSNEKPAVKLENAINFYKLKQYEEAVKIFEELVSIKHKPAQCNFYLGQIAYEQKKYKDAIYYYKTSSDLYRSQGVKTVNMPLILLNTANSLKAIGENDRANNFYAVLKKDFPNSNEAKSIN